MEKNITLRPSTLSLVHSLLQSARSAAVRQLERLSRYYARQVGRDFTVRQTLLLINAQLAFFFAAFPVGGSLVVHLCAIAWFVHALLWCSREL